MSLIQKLPVSGIILTQDNETTISRALDSLNFCREIWVIDHGSNDRTVEIARKAGARVATMTLVSFAESRNLGLNKAKENWVLYLDSDEVVTGALRSEIEKLISTNKPLVGKMKRRNWFLGVEMYNDEVTRLFHRLSLSHWEGRVHEHPVVTGEMVSLKHALEHDSHKSITEMLHKTNHWSEIEADLRINAKHPPMSGWRLGRIALTTWWQQLVSLKIWKYGRGGWFEGYYQMISSMITYVKLWERQRN